MKNQMPQNSEIQQESTSDKVEIDEWMTKDFRTLYGSPKGVLKTMQKICIHKVHTSKSDVMRRHELNFQILRKSTAVELEK